MMKILSRTFKYQLLLILLISIFSFQSMQAQVKVVPNGNVGVGTLTPHSTAKLQILSNDKGFLLPRLDMAQRDALTALGPAEGLQIYLVSDDTDLRGPYYWDPFPSPGEWVKMDATSVSWNDIEDAQAWLINGNDNSTETDFLGTNESVPLRIGADGDEVMRITPSGDVGIGVEVPETKLQVEGVVTANSFSATDNHVDRIIAPSGATYKTSGSVTGAIKVTLPQTWTNTMMKFTVRVYDYTTNESFDVKIAGYNYTGGRWYNPSARVESSSLLNRNFPVYFGHDGTKCCVVIGDESQTWTFPQVSVIDFQGGHYSTASQWDDGWDISLIANITPSMKTRTILNTQVNNWSRSGDDVYYSSGSGNVGIGTVNPQSKLHVDGTVRVGERNGGSAVTGAAFDSNGQLVETNLITEGDNLGNHSAIQTIQLNDNFLNNDGGINKGIRISNEGNVGIGLVPTKGPLQIEATYSEAWFNRFGHLVLKNNNDSDSEYWGISPRNTGDLGIGKGQLIGSGLDYVSNDAVIFRAEGTTSVLKGMEIIRNNTSTLNLLRMHNATNGEFAGGIEMMESTGSFGTGSQFGARIYYNGVTNTLDFKTGNGTNVIDALTITRDNGHARFGGELGYTTQGENAISLVGLDGNNTFTTIGLSDLIEDEVPQVEINEGLGINVTGGNGEAFTISGVGANANLLAGTVPNTYLFRDQYNKFTSIFKQGDGIQLEGDGGFLKISSDDDDSDPFNELQNLEFTTFNDRLEITSGNYVNLSSLRDDPNAWKIGGNNIVEGDVLGTNNGLPLELVVGGDPSLTIDTDGRWIPKGDINQTGSSFLSIGLNSGVEGNNNIYIGKDAGFNSLSGTSDNTIVGFKAGRHISEGGSNVILGSFAGEFFDGSSNVIIGKAGLNFTGGDPASHDDCILIGNNAGNSVMGDLNIVVGVDSGSGLQITSESNIVLGDDSGDFNLGDCNILIGQNVEGKINRNNSVGIGHNAFVNNSNKVYFNSGHTDGEITGDQPYTEPSDRRFKTFINDDVPGLNMVLGLRPVNYKFDYRKYTEHLIQLLPEEDQVDRLEGLNYASINDRDDVGFIAQEVHQLIQSLNYDFGGLNKPDDENPTSHYTLSYSSFVVPLVKAVQEQQAIIEIQDERLIELATTNASQAAAITTILEEIEILKNRIKALEE